MYYQPYQAIWVLLSKDFQYFMKLQCFYVISCLLHPNLYLFACSFGLFLLINQICLEESFSFPQFSIFRCLRMLVFDGKHFRFIIVIALASLFLISRFLIFTLVGLCFFYLHNINLLWLLFFFFFYIKKTKKYIK